QHEPVEQRKRGRGIVERAQYILHRLGRVEIEANALARIERREELGAITQLLHGLAKLVLLLRCLVIDPAAALAYAPRGTVQERTRQIAAEAVQAAERAETEPGAPIIALHPGFDL